MTRTRIWARTWLLYGLLLCAVTSAGLTSHSANASNVQFVGNTSYVYLGNVATLKADQVGNFSPSGFSGTLKLELWAFPAPFTGSFQLGYKLAQYTLGQLVAGFSFYNVNSGPVVFLPPPNGVWVFVLMVTEFTGAGVDSGYVADDWVNFSTPVIIGPPPPPPGQLTGPGTVTFPAQQVGTVSAPSTITITNTGGLPVTISSVLGSDLGEFPGSTTCLTVIAAGTSCQIVISFQPTAVGARSETIVITSDGVGSPQAISVSGTGVSAPPPPPSGTITAVEYYYAAWNFYFVTSDPGEIAALDGGAFGGLWKRTGETFNVWSNSTNGALATYRFFSIAFDPKSSHFYTPYINEYNILRAGTAWEYEGIAFYVLLPDANGHCPAGTVILYRLYNNGMGGAPNHRFTISVATFNAMKAAGYQFEGNGLTGAYACVPQ